MKKRIIYSPWSYGVLALLSASSFQLVRSGNWELVMYHVLFSLVLCVSVRFIVSMYFLGTCQKYDGIYCTEDERHITLLILSLGFVSIVMGAFGALHASMVKTELPNGVYVSNYFPFIFSEAVTLTSTLCVMGIGVLIEIFPNLPYRISARFNLGTV